MNEKVRSVRRIGAVVLLVASATCALAQTVTGTISGVVYGTDGRGLAGAPVWANIVSAVAKPANRAMANPNYATVTNSAGSFTLTQIPAGQYRLCTRSTIGYAIDPCVWGGAPLVQITATSPNVAGESIRLTAGAPLQLHLNDPSGYMASASANPKATMIVGLATAQGFLPLPMTQKSATSRDFQMNVPLNLTQNVSISTAFFKLADQTGGPLGAGPIAASFASAAQAPVITVQVTGLK